MSSAKHTKSTNNRQSSNKNEIDAENVAKRRKDSQTQGNQDDNPKKILKCLNWNQTADEVIVTLVSGKRLSSNDLSVNFFDTEVKLMLTDGIKWFCKFNQPIKKEESKAQISNTRIILKMKKTSNVTWGDLTYHDKKQELKSSKTEIISQSGQVLKSKKTPKEKQDLTVHERKVVSSSVQATDTCVQDSLKSENSSKDPNMEIIEKSHKLTKEKEEITQISTLPVSTATSTSNSSKAVSIPAAITTMASLGGSTTSAETCTTFTDFSDGSVPSIPSASELLKGSPTQDEQPDQFVRSIEEEVYQLNHVNYDFYEHVQKADEMQVYIYVKEVLKESVVLKIVDRQLSVYFSTSDCKFLSLHKDTAKDTKFCWEVTLVEEVDVPRCRTRILSTKIDLKLKKKNSRMWKAFEACIAKPAATSITPTRDFWMSAGKSDSSKASTDFSSPRPQNKIIFDEMESEKDKDEPYQTGYEDGLEDIGKTTSCARTNIMTENTLQTKPTCMVSPLNKTVAEKPILVNPGMTGLDNLGNTCFMNSVLQVLANTRELRDFFLDQKFQKEINTDNPLGMGGKLALTFAVLMKVIWSGKSYSHAPSKLKTLIGMKWNQFTGFAQHDAQELLAFLLDGLHEDLNRVKTKPYIEATDSDGRSDEVVANEAWGQYRKRNDSVVVDLFQGQYKSTLVCPVCNKISITFDPFMHLSVPLPKKQRLLPVIFMSKDPFRKPVKYMIRIAKDGVVEMLKESISKKTGVNQKDLRVFETHAHKFCKIFSKGMTLANVLPSDVIIVSEVLSEKVAGESVVEICVIQRTCMPTSNPTRCGYCQRDCEPDVKLKRCTRCFRIGYCDHFCQKRDWQRHRPMCSQIPEGIGIPFIVSLPESQLTFKRLCNAMMGYSRNSTDLFQPPVNSEETEQEFRQDGMSTRPSSTSLSSCSGASDCSNISETSSDTAEFSSFSSTSTITSQDVVDPLEGDTQPQFSEDGQGDGAVSTESDNNTGKMLESSSCDDKGGLAEASSGPPTRCVYGVQQDDPDNNPSFYIKPCDKEGKNLKSKEDAARLKDLGDEPLTLSSQFLAIDWKNSEKCKPYVLVQGKPLEYDEDKSMETALHEEQGNITLDNCLSLFTQPEVLSPEHSWYCPSCKEHREASKQLSIWRLPHTLIIQLKRFSFRNFIWRDKIDKLVEFPLRALDMSPYYIGKLPTSEPPPIYDLYGVINHHGGLLGGHYTSYARCPDTKESLRNEVDWRLFDDNHVTTTSESRVLTSAAYVLFYRRRSMLVSLPPSISTSGLKSADANNQTKLVNKCDNRSNSTNQDNDYDEEFSQPDDSSFTSQDLPLPENIHSALPQHAAATASYTDMDSVD